MRNSALLGTYSRTMPRVLRGSEGCGRFLMRGTPVPSAKPTRAETEVDGMLISNESEIRIHSFHTAAVSYSASHRLERSRPAFQHIVRRVSCSPQSVAPSFEFNASFLGPLGFNFARHGPTTRPSVERTAKNALMLSNRV